MANEARGNQATRRGFLGGMTALTAASYNRVLGANDRVGIGFIGFGLIGKQHIYEFQEVVPGRRPGRDVRRLQAAPGGRSGVHGKPQCQGLQRFSQDVREQGHRWSGGGHARPLACHAHHHGLRGRQGRLCREAAHGFHRRRQVDAAGDEQVQARGGGGHAAQPQSGPPGGQEDHRERRAGQDPDGQAGSRRPQCLSGFRKDAGGESARRFRLRHVARAGAQEAVSEASRAVPFPLVLGLFRRPVDQPGRSQRGRISVGHGRERPDEGGVVRRTVHPGGRWRNARHSGVPLRVPWVHDDDGCARS